MSATWKKVVLTIFAFIVTAILIGAVQYVREGHSAGIYGAIIGVGLVGVLTVIWKKKPGNTENKDISKSD